MKLNRETRDLVTVGTVIQYTARITTTVTNVMETGRAKNVTLRTSDGFNVYMVPVSELYGCKIIKGA